MIAFKKNKSFLVPMLGAALAAILLLGGLQYYWVGQVSDGYRERMRANLHTGVLHLTEEFNRELAHAYLSLQMDATTMRDQDWDRYAQRYDRWQATSAYPQLIDTIYLVQLYDYRGPRILQFDQEQRRFVVETWPPHLQPLLQMLAPPRTDSAQASVPQSGLPPIMDDIPALIIPLSRVLQLSDQQELAVEANLIFGDDIIQNTRRSCPRCTSSVRSVQSGYTVVTLNQAYLAETVIPTLARRHLSDGSEMNYDLAVLDRDTPDRVIYRSDPNFAGEKLRSVDDEATLLDLKLDSLLLNETLRANNPQEADGEQTPRVLVGVYSSESASAAGAAQGSQNGGRWRLIIKHRVGSLEAAVMSLRSLNLLISFTPLLLLAVSVFVIIVTTRRSQQLARQQMEFVAAVSHELRTPLAVICSAGDNLADGFIRDTTQVRQYGTVIRTEGHRLGEMVEQVLEFAGVQSGQGKYALGPVDVRELIERALASCRPLNSLHDFAFELDIPDDLPPVIADRAALQRALQNLIDNAIKYSGTSRWVGIRAREMMQGRDAVVSISVADRGIGINPAARKHIFEPFYRGQEAVEAQIRGSGLGLSLVKHMVESMGGRLTFESSLNQGTCFTVQLPVLTAEADESLTLIQPLPAND